MNWFSNIQQTSWLFEAGAWTAFVAIGLALVALLIVLSFIFRAIWFVFVWLLLALPVVAFVVAWPDLWFWSAPIFVVIAGLAMVVAFFRRRRLGWGTFLVALAALLGLLGGYIGLGGPLPGPGPYDGTCVTSEGSPTPTHFFFYDQGKQTPGSFGPAVANRAGDEATFSELHDRRCADPALTSAHYAVEGFIPLSLIDEYTARFMASRSLWNQAIAQMEMKESKRTAVEIVAVPSGSASLYMQPLSNGSVQVRQGSTVLDGTALKIIFEDGTWVEFRFECGFQPVFETPPPDIPPCAGDCDNPPCPPEWGPDCLQPKDVTESTLNNPEVDDWKLDGSGGGDHQIGTGTESTTYQDNPQQDAADAQEQAEQQQEVVQEEHEEAVDEAEDVEESDEDLGYVPPPPP